ncbi:hypothetical protein DIS24_g3718 [Lasiodiplodia hormozganensis]|uniref:G-patch domain-containing protein n=1 Tax=Lasiodiplodia hormozganensis TaxID=869390 RepID=A0AA39YWM8_9PEZI|nr:hypothetical protein DIS24_g3718 [Lasiodiplodia hormozganensis]
MSASDDETYTIPIKDQRYFGAGLKRKRVKFVPASSPATPQSSASGPEVSDLYLSIVGGAKKDGSSSAQSTPEASGATVASASAPERCPVCDLPLAEGHESSLAHQVCVQHSHPPSAIERSRKGLSFLQAHGWDPDSRKGLGKGGEGILHPIKLKEKNDTVGLGMKVPKNAAPKAKVEKLNAKEVRKNEEQAKRRKEQLQRLFYSSDDVLRYLGEG